VDDRRSEFDYLLNTFERASQADKPADHGYGDKRRTLYAYVRALESERDALREVCAAAYQLAGAVGAPLLWLDTLADAANGEMGLRTTAEDREKLLPIGLDDLDEVGTIKAERDALRALLRECRDYVEGCTYDKTLLPRIDAALRGGEKHDG